MKAKLSKEEFGNVKKDSERVFIFDYMQCTYKYSFLNYSATTKH